MHCPSCGHGEMLFEDHHGMEQNVCQNCGTVVECNLLSADLFQPGTQEVSCNYRSAAKQRTCKMLNPSNVAFTESRETMWQLMDRLNLPIATKELAVNFLQYTKSLDKVGRLGACVYLAMKQHDIPITIKYISNYLQVDHFTVGKVMKKLEKRISVPIQPKTFSPDRLAHIIFNQATFGGRDGGKKRFDLLLRKTEQLLQLLLEYQTCASHPHLIILAAGYIVWRNLKRRGWRESIDETHGNDFEIPGLRSDSVKSYLCEVGIQLSCLSSLYDKIKIITNILSKFAGQIPWYSSKIPSKDMVYCHLDDFIKYKSQLISLAAQDTSEVVITKTVNSNEVGDGQSSTSCDRTGVSASPVSGKHEVRDDIAKYDLSGAILESSPEEVTPKYNVNFDYGTEYATLVISTDSNGAKRKSHPSSKFSKVKYTRLTNVRQIPLGSKSIKNDISDSKDENYEIDGSGNINGQSGNAMTVRESYMASLSFP
ncbi:transcription factor IIIB 50 kDa subunit-like [Hetaerina americana]|uniref:transcription factor IIIB 50 kDa subunit-like n=1 Tax=Hetaerina americana TaxID=62018 RepID=UPI003A7F56D0